MKSRRARLTIAGLGGLALGGALIMSACGGSGSSGSAGPATKGGIYRVAETDFGFTDNFDPTGEYTSEPWAMYRGLLIRTLLGYRLTAGVAGNTLVPDLATSVPASPDGGKTWTFTLKTGVRFAPPVNRAITSHDIVEAFTRIDTPALAAQYGFYYSAIAGWDAFAKGRSSTISGITTPNNQTISFHLTTATPDFPYRLTLPATGPIPSEVAKCFPAAGTYGRDLVASGPYMIAGSASVKITSCAAITPMSGFDPASKLILVRNPNYAPSTDDPTIRRALPDGFSFTIDTNQTDIFNRINAGLLDDSPNTPPASIVATMATNSASKQRIRISPDDRTSYLTMNLATAPFDDIHVRKAVNLIMDKAGLQQAQGGPLFGTIATHIVPNTMFNNDGAITGYDPYASPSNAGDLAAAQAEMRLSKYDPAHDGKCDVAACKSVFAIASNTIQGANMVPVIENSLAKIGIALNFRELPPGSAYTTISTASRNVPFASNAGWSKDYADPSTFMVLFQSTSIAPVGNINYSLVGLTPAIAAQIGVPYPKGALIPSIDAQFGTCAQTYAAGARQSCWIGLDKTLMEKVVPWVPYLSNNAVHITSSAVTAWDFDQSSGGTSYARVAVNPATQSH
jgi:peptide/nickel transport system substrate-binding protein